ncbi:lipoprotein [Streptomyces prasinosporus]|uniref:Lipoprotein n=1 Tax=Streptomyces prasinosporus TaxID=68256 RepID=A0ABP6TVH8_9ACTN
MRRKGMKAGAIVVAAVTGSVVLAGCGGDGDSGSGSKGNGASASASSGAGAREKGTAAVRTAYDRTAEAETARMEIEVKAAADGKTVTSTGRGTLDMTDGDSAMTVTAEGRRLEQRVVDQVLYQKMEGQKAPGGKSWIRIDLAKAAEKQGVSPQQIGDPAQSAAYAKAISDKDVTEAGTERIDGVDTTRYEVEVDVAELPGGAQLRRQVGPTLPMRVWLDDQGRLRRQQVDMTVKASAAGGQPESGSSPRQVKVSTVMEFSDFGTEVDAEAPPAQQVADMTDEALRGGQGRS